MKSKSNKHTSFFSKKSISFYPEGKKPFFITVPHSCTTRGAICDTNVDNIVNALYEELDPNKVMLLGSISRDIVDLNRSPAKHLMEGKDPEVYEDLLLKWIEDIKGIFREKNPILLDVHTASRSDPIMKGRDIVIYDMPESGKDNKFTILLKEKLEEEFGKGNVGIESEKFMERDFIVQTILKISKERNSEIALLEFARDLTPKRTAKKVARALNKLREEVN